MRLPQKHALLGQSLRNHATLHRLHLQYQIAGDNRHKHTTYDESLLLFNAPNHYR